MQQNRKYYSFKEDRLSVNIKSSISRMADEAQITDALCPSWATGVGYMGVAAAVVLSNWGSAVSSHRCHCAPEAAPSDFASRLWQRRRYAKINVLEYCTMEFCTYLCYISIPCGISHLYSSDVSGALGSQVLAWCTQVSAIQRV